MKDEPTIKIIYLRLTYNDGHTRVVELTRFDNLHNLITLDHVSKIEVIEALSLIPARVAIIGELFADGSVSVERDQYIEMVRTFAGNSTNDAVRWVCETLKVSYLEARGVVNAIVFDR